MSRGGLAGARSLCHRLATCGKDYGAPGVEAVPVGTASTVSTGRGAPVVRNMVRPAAPVMLTVREVAEELAVCRATVYALLERGELERVWVGRSIRIPASSLEALLSPGAALREWAVSGSRPYGRSWTLRTPAL
jgi:excisionase family DNA binding protein